MFGINKNNFSRKSYAQCGEDIIIDVILRNVLKVKDISYLDIGAHHPKKFSNTALFYENGCNGVNIEPDPFLFEKFPQGRKGDVNLNIAIGDENAEMDFYIMKNRPLNTLSKAEADRMVQDEGEILEKTVKVKVYSPDHLFKNILKTSKFPTFLTIDVEGFELQILEKFKISDDFYPKVIICETINYSVNGNSKKNLDLINFILDLGYYHYADTMINSIFVWKQDLKGILKEI